MTTVSDALWKVFENTGHIGAYLLYKDYSRMEVREEVAPTAEKEIIPCAEGSK